ncbi:MAG: bifunctional pyr operon transcriptional regulator/uracil phosphoribosyltransferase PyrR [Bacteroidota bacterium]
MQDGHTKRIFDKELLSITINRLCYQLIENHNDFENAVIVGIQSRGVLVSRRIYKRLQEINPNANIQYGELDISFYRDDFRRRELIVPSATKMDIVVEGKNVVLVDDVLYTGRTIRAALDALLDFGRPLKVELLTLIDRKFSRELPIAADYIGQSIDTIASEKVLVQLQSDDGDDGVWITSSESKL